MANEQVKNSFTMWLLGILATGSLALCAAWAVDVNQKLLTVHDTATQNTISNAKQDVTLEQIELSLDKIITKIDTLIDKLK